MWAYALCHRSTCTMSTLVKVSLLAAGWHHAIPEAMMLSAVKTRFDLSRYYIRHCDKSGRKWIDIRITTDSRHGRAIGCLFWEFCRKLTAFEQHRSISSEEITLKLNTYKIKFFQIWRSSRHSRLPHGREQQSIEQPALPAGRMYSLPTAGLEYIMSIAINSLPLY